MSKQIINPYSMGVGRYCITPDVVSFLNFKNFRKGPPQKNISLNFVD